MYISREQNSLLVLFDKCKSNVRSIDAHKEMKVTYEVKDEKCSGKYMDGNNEHNKVKRVLMSVLFLILAVIDY